LVIRDSDYYGDQHIANGDFVLRNSTEVVHVSHPRAATKSAPATRIVRLLQIGQSTELAFHSTALATFAF
jgi:hypothetical protein